MTEFDLGQVVGADGKGIVSIELINTSGKNKTYRITFTDESYFDYTVKDGEDAISAIVTSWESTLSDSKVASEKLTKDSLDGKSDVGHSHTWTTQTLGSYGTLYVNETLRLVIFYYSRSYNYTSTNDITLETGIIPSDYRLSVTIPCSAGLPFVAGRITSEGNLICRPTQTGTLGTTLQAMWTY